jgi:hypothetical protein
MLPALYKAQHSPLGGVQPGDPQGDEGGCRVPRRPGGGMAPRGSIEAGLRDLAKDTGPDIRQLSRGDTEGLQAIMLAAQTPADWPRDAKAAAVLSVVQELIEELANPRWKAAAMAAFRFPADQYMGSDYDSLAGRWRGVARRDGAADQEIKDRVEAFRGFWMSAAGTLAERLQRKLEELNSMPHRWEVYQTGLPPAPPHSLPISFLRTDVLYRFRGYQGVQSLSYRWLLAHAPVDHYEPVAWYYSEPDAPVDVVPFANCSLDGALRDLPQGGRSGTLKFSHVLESGESYFFAYMTEFNSDRPCRPLILYEVRGREMRSLVIRAQFDPRAIPDKCWYFDVEAQNEGWETPSDGASELLDIAENGYVDHEFNNCRRGRKFGLRWKWPAGV